MVYEESFTPAFRGTVHGRERGRVCIASVHFCTSRIPHHACSHIISIMTGTPKERKVWRCSEDIRPNSAKNEKLTEELPAALAPFFQDIIYLSVS